MMEQEENNDEEQKIPSAMLCYAYVKKICK